MKCGQRMQLFSFHGIAKESILPPAAIRFRAEKRQRVPWCTAICTINPPSTMARARLQLPTAADQTATWLCPQANILASFLPCCYENSRFCSPFFFTLSPLCVWVLHLAGWGNSSNPSQTVHPCTRQQGHYCRCCWVVATRHYSAIFEGQHPPEPTLTRTRTRTN